MSRKRRQRSTAIRKRIEKKQREEQKARKKAAKAAGKEDAFRVQLRISRAAGDRTVAALADLEKRLAAEPIRGWTPGDLGGDRGLTWFSGVISEAQDTQAGPLLVLEISDTAKKELLERLEALEMAASALKIDYEGDFGEVSKSLGQAVELMPEEDEED